MLRSFHSRRQLLSLPGKGSTAHWVRSMTSGKGGGRGKKEDKPKKPNFDRDVLLPASRGELRGHSSGIPRLAARRPKAQLRNDITSSRKRRQKFLLREDEEGEWDDELEDRPGGLLASLSRGADEGTVDEQTPDDLVDAGIEEEEDNDEEDRSDDHSPLLASLPPEVRASLPPELRVLFSDEGTVDEQALGDLIDASFEEENDEKSSVAQEQLASLLRVLGMGTVDEQALGDIDAGIEEGEERSDYHAPEQLASLLRGMDRGTVDSLDELVDMDGFEEEGEAKEEELFDDDKYYWREEEYETLPMVGDLSGKGENEPFTIYYGKKALQPRSEDDDDDGVPGLDKGEGDWEEEEEEAEEEEVDDDGDKKSSEDFSLQEDEKPKHVDPEQLYFFDQNDIVEVAAQSHEKPEYDGVSVPKVLPLPFHGPDLDDFLEAVIDTPSEYVRATRINLHPHSQREPKPILARRGPSIEFVKSHKRFLYVTGLPPLEVDGEGGDLRNPIHRSVLRKTIARIVDVDSSRVFAINATSGFVGFASSRELADALARGPSEHMISSEPDLRMPDASLSEHEFIKSYPANTVLLLSKIPGGDHTPTSLARELFPVETELGSVYGGRSRDDFRFLSPTSVLVRFSSVEQAQSALDSTMVRERLQEIGQYPVQYYCARRELLHAGFASINRDQELRRMGPRLVVDGDMPSKRLYLSHAGVIQLRNLDPTLTKEAISAKVQPFCAQFRDVQGSVEFVTCRAGHRSGTAYVGFDIPGEAEALLNSLPPGGRLLGLGDRPVIARMVHDRRFPGQKSVYPDKRPERTEEEILDDLNNWEKYVDPADLEELEKAGIQKIVLTEAFRNMRFKNATFGALDSTVRDDAIEPEKASGELYKELVQLYIKTLKECIATPDNVGAMYKGLHLPDEEIDLSIFDREKDRQKMLQERRETL